MGATKYIWFAGIKGHDITDDHVDGASLFSKPGQALVEAPFPGDHSIWAADQENQAAVLAASTDAQGQAITVTRIGDPDYNRLPANVEYAGYAKRRRPHDPDRQYRDPCRRRGGGRERIPRSHHRANPAPSLDQGGGGIHCVTQQEPVTDPVLSALTGQ
jgi:agmatine deiminase